MNKETIEAWEARGALVDEGFVADGRAVGIDLGLADCWYVDGHGIFLETYRLLPQIRRLSGIGGWNGQKVDTYLLAGALLARKYRQDGYDPTLYHGYRNILPPRRKTPSGGCTKDNDRSASYWYADLIVYEEGVLPSGELYRSTGHWNPVDEVEIFQVLRGEIAMITAGMATDGRKYLVERRYRERQMFVVPPGAWHLTYVLAGPAVVFNIYTMQHLSDDVVTARHATKYSRTAPVEVCLVEGRSESDRERPTERIYSAAAAREWGRAANRAELVAAPALGEASLAGWFLHAGSADMASIEKQLGGSA